MAGLFAQVWQPFLTGTDGQVKAAESVLPPPNWKQAWWPLRATVPRFLVLAIVGVLAVVFFAVVVLGGVSL